MANVYGYWECPYCRNIIRGDNRECPNCGTPVPERTKYLPPDAPEVKEAIGHGRAIDEYKEYVPPEKESKEANWICEYCHTQNPASSNSCEGCGSARFEAKKDYFGHSLDFSEEDKEQRDILGLSSKIEEAQYESSSSDSEYDWMSDRTVDEYYDIPKETNIFVKGFQVCLEFLQEYWKPVTIGLSVIFSLIFLIWLFYPVTRAATITGFEWERTIAVEEFKLCHEDDWSMPSGATLEYTKEEIHHYNKVLDHYETKTKKIPEQVLDGYDISYKDLGNGQFEEVKKERYKTVYRTETYQEAVYKNVPEYRTKYYYTIGRWKEVTSLISSGVTKEVYWPECKYPSSVSNPNYGDRRRGKTSEKYYAIIISENGDVNKKSYSYSEWLEHSEGEEITYKSFRFTTKPL